MPRETQTITVIIVNKYTQPSHAINMIAPNGKIEDGLFALDRQHLHEIASPKNRWTSTAGVQTLEACQAATVQDCLRTNALQALATPLLPHCLCLNIVQCTFQFFLTLKIFYKRNSNQILGFFRPISQGVIEMKHNLPALRRVRKKVSCNVPHEDVRKNLVVISDMFLQ